MTERQESSVMASIQDILRDAKEQERKAAETARIRLEEAEKARLEAIRRQQEEEESRLREEEEERKRRAYEEQRRQAELEAMQRAAVEKARADAEAQARLAQIQQQQEHEAKLHQLQHDKSKKTLKIAAAVLGLMFLVGAPLGGYKLYSLTKEKEETARQLTELQDKIATAERERTELNAKLAAATDPEETKRLKAQKDEADRKIAELNKQITDKGGTAAPAKPGGNVGGPAGGPAAPRPANPTPPRPANTCRAGDPLCAQ